MKKLLYLAVLAVCLLQTAATLATPAGVYGPGSPYAIMPMLADPAARLTNYTVLSTNGTFTITNGGVYGSLLSTPIVNPPQSGVLGMHAIQDRPVARDGQVVIRPMMYLALTYDHRIVDGREAVSFLKRIKDCLENPVRLLLDV